MELKIEYVPITDIKPYAGNAKLHPQEQIDQIKTSINLMGFDDPIAIWKNGEIIEGHGRYLAAQQLGLETVPIIRLDNLTDEQRRAYTLIHNKLTMNTGFDVETLNLELAEIQTIDMAQFDFTLEPPEVEMYTHEKEVDGRIAQDFIIPPFSILNSTSGEWAARKKKWAEMELCSTQGRPDGLICEGLNSMTKKFGCATINGTSKFDPVLAEIMYYWFSPDGGLIFDPFAGGTTRGAVAAMTGHCYKGIDLRQEQIDDNERIIEKLGLTGVEYYCDDSQNADKYIEDGTADMIMTCPPYADLEVYSDDPRDISNMDYPEFIAIYRNILTTAVRKLKENRFAVVVGDVRDKKGFYRQFVSDTENIMRDAGAGLYNECILVDPVGTGAMRVRKQFNGGRKVVKRHQNVLIFFKGNPKTIKDNFKQIQIPDNDSDAME